MKKIYKGEIKEIYTGYLQVIIKRNGDFGITPTAPATSRLRKGYFFVTA